MKYIIIYIYGFTLIYATSPLSHGDSPSYTPSDQLNSLCNVSGSPFIYDKSINQYSVAINKTVNGHITTTYYILRYNPFTGSPLSIGEQAFYSPDMALLSKISGQLIGVKDITTVKKILGSPEYEYGETRAYKWELLYKSKSNTTDFIIQKHYDDADVHVGAFGKLKPASDTK